MAVANSLHCACYSVTRSHENNTEKLTARRECEI